MNFYSVKDFKRKGNKIKELKAKESTSKITTSTRNK
jgi:hypothetical protein